MLFRLIKLVGVEFSKLRHQRLCYIALGFIILTVVLSVLVAPGESAEIAETTRSGGFAPFSRACLNGLQLGAIFLLIFSSMTIASESSTGTLRMILTKPFRRGEFILTKLIVLIILTLGIMLLVGLLTFILVGQFYGFGNVIEPSLSPDEAPYEYVTKTVMLRYSIYSLILTLLPLIAIALFGLFISTLIENVGVAVGLSILVYLLLDYLIGGLAEWMAPYLFNHYNTFYFSTLADLSQGILTEIWHFQAIDTVLGLKDTKTPLITTAKQWVIIKSIIIPIGYSILFLITSLIIFRRKDVLV